MHILPVHAEEADRAPQRRIVSVVSLLLLAAVIGVVLFVSLRSPLKDDIAWLLYVARRWMAGRELYVDVVEVNPPLIVWISAIPIGLAQWFGVDSQTIAMPLFVAIVLGFVWWGANLLRSYGGVFANRAPVFAVIGSVFLIVPAGDLGQREHLLVAGFLPYLLLLAQSMDGKRASRWTYLAAGVLAGLGCALKPRYGAAFAALECLALTAGLRPWRMMTLAAGAALLGYAGLVAVICPAYLQHAVPLALALYGATDVPMITLLTQSGLLIGGQVIAISLLWLRRRKIRENTLMLTLVVFAATSTVICFVDGKDWYYHRLPATIITLLALLLWVVTEQRADRRLFRLPLIGAVVTVAVMGFVSIQRLEPEVMAALEPRATTVQRLEQIIRTEHARTYVAFSEWIALGFPVVNETGVAWASRFDSMWALKGEVWRAGFDPETSKEWPIGKWVAHDFITGCPDIAVVDTRETTNYLKVLRAADPAFSRAWSRYRQIAAFDGLKVFRRGKGGCLDVWVAAEAKPAATIR